MSDPVWYRSLYWRIAFGFVAMLAVLLLVQGVVFLWLTDQFFGAPRTPTQLAAQIAEDLSAELQQRPDVDLEKFVPRHFSRIYQPFLVMMNDGRGASNRPDALPPDMGRVVAWHMRFEAGGNHEGSRPDARGGRPEFDHRPPPNAAAGRGSGSGMPPPPMGFGRRGGPRYPVEYAAVKVNDQQLGVVAVPANPPPVSVALRVIGPALSWFGLGLLVVGATLTALLVFRPAHKRLRDLEQAASALGEGRTDVRASEKGADEVTSLARTFNRMAVDLDTRARQLAESDRVRRQLLADVSHELMTPLSAIRGYVETLGMSDLPIDEPTRQRYLGIVEEETHKLEAIIGDLLDLARLEGGGDTLRVEAVAVEDLFGRVADRHQPSLRDRNITLDVRVDDGTPKLRGDAARLEQALQNVAANAIRHTPSGGHITLLGSRAGEFVCIRVRDTGPGIPPEHLPRVFDRFYKVDVARAGTAVPSGSGLGLSIVRAIIERHGGSVLAANAPQGGASFELRIPAA
ncbi:MAG TPA: HAMP domain-containing sensor histidine kinase [Vicinamibacterales bacterium]|nr:HAMP domain-containing sensor histidine kinase [Vicinamibacterales bacterium]